MPISAKHNGFTLIELMVVVAVVAVILAIAAPNFSEFRRNNRITGAANDLLGTIQSARTEAIKRQAPVAVCPSDNPENPAATCTGGPFRGWIAFTDADNNCIRDPAKPEEMILRVGARIDAASTEALNVVANGNCISFGADGFLQQQAQLVPTNPQRRPVSHALFCDIRGHRLQQESSANTQQLSTARGIDITRTGRVRITRVMNEIDKWATEATPVACRAPG